MHPMPTAHKAHAPSELSRYPSLANISSSTAANVLSGTPGVEGHRSRREPHSKVTTHPRSPFRASRSGCRTDGHALSGVAVARGQPPPERRRQARSGPPQEGEPFAYSLEPG